MHAQKLVEKARDAVERRAWDLAIELYMQALSLEPDHLEARRGLRAAALKKYDAYYPSAVTRAIGTVGARISGWISKLFKNHERHMAACEQVLSKDPKNAGVGMTLGEAAMKAGHKNAAIAAYEGVLSVESEHLEALKGLGRMLYQTGEPREALTAYEKAMKLAPRDQEAARMRKNLAAEVSISAAGLDQAKHSRDILRDRDETSKLDDDARRIRSTEGLAESAKSIEESLEESPDDPVLLVELANRYSGMKQYDKAIEIYEKALALDPENNVLKLKLGDLRLAEKERALLAAQKSGDPEETSLREQELKAFRIEEFRSRVAAHPTDLTLHFQLGMALYDVDDLDGAIGEFQQTIRDPRRKIESLTMLGNCFIAKGMYDLAENQLEKALVETPGMSDRTKDILYSLGMLKEKQGQPEAALAQLKKIYEVDISFRDVSRRMEELKKQISG